MTQLSYYMLNFVFYRIIDILLVMCVMLIFTSYDRLIFDVFDTFKFTFLNFQSITVFQASYMQCLFFQKYPQEQRFISIPQGFNELFHFRYRSQVLIILMQMRTVNEYSKIERLLSNNDIARTTATRIIVAIGSFSQTEPRILYYQAVQIKNLTNIQYRLYLFINNNAITASRNNHQPAFPKFFFILVQEKTQNNFQILDNQHYKIINNFQYIYLQAMIKLQVSHSHHAKNNKQKVQAPSKYQIDNLHKLDPIQPNQNLSVQTDKNQKILNARPEQQQTRKKQQQSRQSLEQGKKIKDYKAEHKKEGNRNDSELQKIDKIHETQTKVKKTIQQLLFDYQDAIDDVFVNYGHNPEKQFVIRKHLQQLNTQRNKRQQKIKKINDRQFRTLQQKQKKQQQKSSIQHQKSKQKLKRRVELKIKSLNAQKQMRKQKQAQFEVFYKQFKQKKPKYKVLQQQFNTKQQQEYKLRQKQIRQKIKKNKQPMSLQQIQKFEQAYQQKLSQLSQQLQQKRQLQRRMLQQHQRKLKQIRKSQFYERAKNQRLQIQKKKEEPFKKLERTKQYGTIVKEEYMPKRRKNSQESDDSDDSDVFGVRKRPIKKIETQNETENKKIKYRYLNGESKGFVFQQQRNALNYSQMVKRGNDYLNYIVSLPKKRTQKTQKNDNQSKSQLQQLKPKRPLVPRVPRKENSVYQDSRRPKSIDFGKINNCKQMNGFLDKMKWIDMSLDMENKVINHQTHQNILSLQQKRVKVTDKIVDSLSQKLQILRKM